MSEYRVVTGINFPHPSGSGEKRGDRGDMIQKADLRPEHLAEFLRIGAIEPVDEAVPATALPKKPKG